MKHLYMKLGENILNEAIAANTGHIAVKGGTWGRDGQTIGDGEGEPITLRKEIIIIIIMLE